MEHGPFRRQVAILPLRVGYITNCSPASRSLRPASEKTGPAGRFRTGWIGSPTRIGGSRPGRPASGSPPFRMRPGIARLPALSVSRFQGSISSRPPSRRHPCRPPLSTGPSSSASGRRPRVRETASGNGSRSIHRSVLKNRSKVKMNRIVWRCFRCMIMHSLSWGTAITGA